MTEEQNQSNNELPEGFDAVKQAVNAALVPVGKLIWGYDQISDPLHCRVAEILENVQPERILPPPQNVVGPAIEAFKFAGDNDVLQDFLARLIAKSLDTKTAAFALPSYVDIIKSLVADEGLILQLFTKAQQFPMIDVKLKLLKTGGFNTLHENVSMIAMYAECKDGRLINEYLDHLCRLGLFEIPEGQKIVHPQAYEQLKGHPSIEQIKNQYEGRDDFDVEIIEKVIRVTRLGGEFIKTCVLNKKPKRNIV